MVNLPRLLIGYVPGIRRAPVYVRPPPPSRRVARVSRLVSITGHRFGRLVVVSYAGMGASGSRWRCRYDCGGEKVVERVHLKQGRTRSCGCLWRETGGRHLPAAPPGAQRLECGEAQPHGDSPHACKGSAGGAG